MTILQKGVFLFTVIAHVVAQNVKMSSYRFTTVFVIDTTAISIEMDVQRVLGFTPILLVT